MIIIEVKVDHRHPHQNAMFYTHYSWYQLQSAYEITTLLLRSF